LTRRDLACVTRLHPVGGTVLRLNGFAPGQPPKFRPSIIGLAPRTPIE
jgi:hypothetical protein